MAKYDPLKRFLARQKADPVELSFAEIERLIGKLLPKRAADQDWWAEAVIGRGFKACFSGRERVRFERS